MCVVIFLGVTHQNERKKTIAKNRLRSQEMNVKTPPSIRLQPCKDSSWQGFYKALAYIAIVLHSPNQLFRITIALT